MLIGGIEALIKVRPIDVAGVQRIGAESGFTRHEAGLIRNSIPFAGDIVAGFDDTGGDEDARAIDAGITPPITGVAAGIEVARVISSD